MSRLFKYIGNIAKYIRDGGLTKVSIVTSPSQMRFKGKTVLITGATSGIGLEIAKQFNVEGATVIVTGHSKEKLELIKKQYGFNALMWDTSTNAEYHECMMKTVFEEISPVDILINNAGIYYQLDFISATEIDYTKMLDTNLKGAIFISQAFLKNVKQLNDKKDRNILNISSIAPKQSTTSFYGISKAGIDFLTRELGLYAYKYNVVVNAIAPGPTDSNINPASSKENYYTPRAVDKRVCMPIEIAKLALYLTSEDARHIIGETVTIDGGESIA